MNFKCKDCGYHFYQTEFDDGELILCPDCGSENLIILREED